MVSRFPRAEEINEHRQYGKIASVLGMLASIVLATCGPECVLVRFPVPSHETITHQASHALMVIGALSLMRKLWQAVLSPYWHYSLRAPTSFVEFRGDWAVVTGASRGLGRGYAVALARRGINVILMARNVKALERVAQECEACGVLTHAVEVDFSEGPCSLYPKIETALSDVDGAISILVNNVGGKPCDVHIGPAYCEELDPAMFNSFFKFNCTPAICMTQLLLKDMLQRDRGYVLNVSSLNGLQNCPYLSYYSTAKAYIGKYSACLNAELRGRHCNVWIDTVFPGPVATDGIGRADMPSAHIPDPVVFADCSLSLARTAFANLPWPAHWWSIQSLGPYSHFLPNAVTDARLYKTMGQVMGPG